MLVKIHTAFRVSQVFNPYYLNICNTGMIPKPLYFRGIYIAMQFNFISHIQRVEARFVPLQYFSLPN